MYRFPPEELAMNRLEQDLKQVFSMRPDVTKILYTPQELTEYQHWMTENFADVHQTPYPVSSFIAFPNLSKNTAVRSYIDPGSGLPASPDFLPVHQGTITESQEILSNHDISVGRMLRYFPAHWHANDFFEIYFALSGACPVYFQDEVITVKPGTVLVVAPSIVHANPCYSDDCVLLYYMLRSSTFEQVFWNQFPSGNLMSAFFRQALSSQHATAYLHFETGEDEEISLLLHRIYQEYCHAERYGAQMLNALMSAFFVLLLRRYEGTARLPRRSDFFWKHEFSAILTYIQANFSTITIKSVANHFHYSTRQIGRIVCNCTGLTFEDLILKLKMEQAGKLLQQKDSSIEAVSAAVGYGSSCSFYRAFGKYYGCTPREFAKHNPIHPDTAD